MSNQASAFLAVLSAFKTIQALAACGLIARTVDEKISLAGMLADVSRSTVQRILKGRPVRPSEFERAVPFLKALGFPAPQKCAVNLSNTRVELL